MTGKSVTTNLTFSRHPAKNVRIEAERIKHLRHRPLLNPPCHPRTVVQRKVVTGVGMHGEGGVPALGYLLRALWVDEAVLGRGEDQQRHLGLARRRVVAGGGDELPQCIHARDRILDPV